MLSLWHLRLAPQSSVAFSIALFLILPAPYIDGRPKPTLAGQMPHVLPYVLPDDGCRMLRVRVVASPVTQRVVVEGRLVAPCVSELKSAWKQARQACRGRIVIDLTGMTFIDSSGRAALLAMIGEGARLTAKGVYNKHLAEELMDKARAVLLERDRASVMN